MKKTITIFLLLVAMSAMSFKLTMTDDEKKGLGRVQKIDGIEVYIMSEPLREYEIVGDVSVYDAGISQMYTDDWTKKYVKKAKKLIEDGKTVDAIIYSSGKGANAIKWK